MHQANNGFYFSVEAAQNHNDTFFGDTDRYNPDDKGLRKVRISRSFLPKLTR
ncbi:outer membrane domain protein [Enterobacter roggenkampii]|nr:outer membrane domain protein [Enterobacter roggenkampii]